MWLAKERDAAPNGVKSTLRMLAEDLVIAGFGLATCFASAGLLFLMEEYLGIALFTYAVWLVLPVGAACAGLAGASGFYVGAKLFHHRPTSFLQANVVIAAAATYFFYYTLRYYGSGAADQVTYGTFLNEAITTASYNVRLGGFFSGSTGEMRSLGYVVSAIQVAGFALGGLLVHGYLRQQLYCEACGRYLSRKARETRHFKDPESAGPAVSGVVEAMEQGKLQEAWDIFTMAGESKSDAELRCHFEIRRCGRCDSHWCEFKVERRVEGQWKPLASGPVSGYVDGAFGPLDARRSLFSRVARRHRRAVS